MPTLAQTLAMTTPVSPLLRKARRLGLVGVDALIAAAVARGCDHYRSASLTIPKAPPTEVLGDDELVILLLLGENPYEPMAIRCAAQLARSSRIDPVRLARLARMEKTERVLAHIARAGLEHEPTAAAFWQTLMDHLPEAMPRPEPDLPHWSRFVAMPGLQRGGVAPTRWLVPRE
jgi:hypothetical protein